MSDYTWQGADGGSWQAASNWIDNLGTTALQAPGSLDAAEFIAFSGTVTGAVGADVLAISSGSDLTLGGSGFFNNITVGQDIALAHVGTATLEIASGEVVAATLLTIGGVTVDQTTFLPAGFGSALVAEGTFATSGGIALPALPAATLIQVGASGEVQDSASNFSMVNGGTISINASGRVVLGSSDGTAGAFLVESGHQFSGVGTIAGNVVNNGSVSTDNGGNPITVLSITGNVSGTGHVSAVQELDIGGAIGSGITIGLFGNGGTNAGLLRLASPASDLGTLDVMSVGSTIALSGMSFSSAVWSPGSLTMTGGSGSLTLATSGDFSHLSFITRPDAVSGTDVVVACFAAGTRIATTAGEVAVEALRVGDRVESAFGGTVPVVWLGWRRVDCRRYSRPAAVWPVRIAAGAFAPRVPRRDLLLSPDHAVFVDGMLIPVGRLVNGTTIRQQRMDEITYFHIELPAHDVLVAEGLSCESYLDTGNRSAFVNGGGVIDHQPDFARRVWEAEACAPQVTGGPRLAGVVARLLARAQGGVADAPGALTAAHP